MVITLALTQLHWISPVHIHPTCIVKRLQVLLGKALSIDTLKHSCPDHTLSLTEVLSLAVQTLAKLGETPGTTVKQHTSQFAITHSI